MSGIMGHNLPATAAGLYQKGSRFVRMIMGCLLAAASSAVLAAQPATFPAQQRAAGDPAVVARGNNLYTSFCRACHGPDLRGGDMGGPNLLRSQLVLNDQGGEAIGPVILAGRVPPAGGTAMPAMQLPEADLKAVAEYIHSVILTAQPQGAPPVSARSELNLLVGNARVGERYFKIECASCHSATGDLAGIGTRLTSIEQLQNSWVAGRHMGPPNPAAQNRSATVTVKFADGTAVAGQLQRVDDFVVSLTTDDGAYRSFTRRSGEPRVAAVEVNDPLAGHRALWTKLSDRDMHDVTAYLASLK
jgi:cytochrome c oxidase cbb3-type subunit III